MKNLKLGVVLILGMLFLISCGKSESQIDEISSKMKAAGLKGTSKKLDGFAVKAVLKSMGITEAMTYQGDKSTGLILKMKNKESLDKIKGGLPGLAGLALGVEGAKNDGNMNLKKEDIDKIIVVNGLIASVCIGPDAAKINDIVKSIESAKE